MNERNQSDLEIVSGLRQPTTISGRPTWCDRSRCIATTATATGTLHSTPTHLSAPALIGHLNVTASLRQSQASWPTEPFIKVDLTGLEHDWMPVTGSVTLTCGDAADLVRLLLDLTGTAEIAHITEIASYLSDFSTGRQQ